MARQLTFFELLRLLLSLLLAIVVYFVASNYGLALVYDDASLLSTLSYLLLAVFVPAFIAVLISPILPSLRYKMITATLVLNGITLWALVDVAESLTGLWPLAGAMVRLSTSMTGALLAVLVWKWVKNRWMKGEAKPFTGQPATAMPKTSNLLLWLSLLSIPITYITIFASAFLVLGYSVLILMLLSEMSGVPIIVVVAAFLAPLVAGWVSLRALAAQFFAKPEFQPAQTIPLAKRPLLNAMVKEVCNIVGSREPDNVILHVKPTFFVTQQKMKTFDSAVIKGRTLAMGMPFLPLLTRQELKAILAHEFAHFSGRDTAYSVWVSPVYRSLGESITRLQNTTSSADNRLQVLINLLLFPSLLFLVVFYEYFASIDAIISRSREFRADWIAATHFGSDAFVSALKKVVQYGAYFSEQQAQLSLEKESEYQEHYRILNPVEPAIFALHLEQAMGARESEFDSHPTLPARIGNVPVTETGEDEGNEVLLHELRGDELLLSREYTTMMKQLKEFYAQYQAQFLPKVMPPEPVENQAESQPENQTENQTEKQSQNVG